jgi:hypothetical protein
MYVIIVVTEIKVMNLKSQCVNILDMPKIPKNGLQFLPVLKTDTIVILNFQPHDYRIQEVTKGNTLHLWHVDQLLGNNCKINYYTIEITK